MIILSLFGYSGIYGPVLKVYSEIRMCMQQDFRSLVTPRVNHIFLLTRGNRWINPYSLLFTVCHYRYTGGNPGHDFICVESSIIPYLSFSGTVPRTLKWGHLHEPVDHRDP